MFSSAMGDVCSMIITMPVHQNVDSNLSIKEYSYLILCSGERSNNVISETLVSFAACFRKKTSYHESILILCLNFA